MPAQVVSQSQETSVADAPPRTISVVYAKTKKCRFFGLGLCTKGDACTYAHHTKELRAAPDFFRTKVCPTVLNGGICNNSSCKFAHTKEERRKLVVFARHKEVAMMSAASKPGCEAVAPGNASPCLTQSAQPKVLMTVASDPSSCQGMDDAARRGRPRGCRGGRRHTNGAQQAEAAETKATAANSHHDASSDALGGGESVLYKTKMCKFYTENRCTKGDSCQFAHDEQELKPLPDLRCTKVCPLLISTGECNQPDCRYAHDKNDLRESCEKQAVSRAPSESKALDFCRETTPSTDAGELSDGELSDSEVSENSFRRALTVPSTSSICISPPRRSTELNDEAVDPMLIIQNTFLTFGSPQLPLQQRLRRARSVPADLDKMVDNVPPCRRNGRAKSEWLCRPGGAGIDSDDADALSATWIGAAGGA